jgi:FkbM family methyltransferase
VPIPCVFAPRATPLAGWLRTITRKWEVRGLPRLLYGTHRWLLGTGPAQFAVDRKAVLVLDPDDYFQCMMFYGRYSSEISEVISRLVRPGDRVLDVGAQVGYFSLQLARLVTDTGRVYCFEADPRALERLQVALSINQMDWVEVLPVALSAHKGSMDFYLSEHLGWSTGVKNSHLTDLRRMEVRTVPLDALIMRGDIPNDVRLAKIDVEGLELEVLRGMRGLLGSSRPSLVIEINEMMLCAQGTASSSIRELLGYFGYRLYVIEKVIRWGQLMVRLRALTGELPQTCDLLAISNNMAASVGLLADS